MDIAPAVAAPRPSPPEPVPSGRASPGSGYAVQAVSRPATAFSGDFYFTTETDDALWFAVGDFAGHGLFAAVFAAMIQEALEELVREPEARPTEVVRALDRTLRREVPGNRFATLVVGRVAPHGLVELVNAGHCPPLVARAGGDVEPVGANGPVVGLAPAPRWDRRVLLLSAGDRLLVYTDGLVEAEDGSGEPFGVDRLLALLRTISPGAPLETVLAAVHRFSGGLRADDVTLFALTRRGPREAG